MLRTHCARSLWALSLLLSGCELPEERQARCLGPLVELVAWRDSLGKKEPLPNKLADQEREHVEQVVTRLNLEAGCSSAWNMMLLEKPSSPARRLREEAILQLLGEPPHDYGAAAVGPAGVTVAGHLPVGD